MCVCARVCVCGVCVLVWCVPCVFRVCSAAVPGLGSLLLVAHAVCVCVWRVCVRVWVSLCVCRVCVAAVPVLESLLLVAHGVCVCVWRVCVCVNVCVNVGGVCGDLWATLSLALRRVCSGCV